MLFLFGFFLDTFLSAYPEKKKNQYLTSTRVTNECELGELKILEICLCHPGCSSPSHYYLLCLRTVSTKQISGLIFYNLFFYNHKKLLPLPGLDIARAYIMHHNKHGVWLC